MAFFRDPLSYIGWSWSWWMPVPVIMFNDISFYPQFIFSFTTNIRSYFIQHSANPHSSLLPEWDNYTWRRHLDWIVLKERLMRANYQSFRYISAKEWHLSCSLTLNSSSSSYFFSSFSYFLFSEMTLFSKNLLFSSVTWLVVSAESTQARFYFSLHSLHCH